jgi:CheY-like chemotaxis protein
MPVSELRTILSVEDEPDIQAVIKLSLETVGGFHTTICSSGEEALKLVEHLKPDLIMLDVMMPTMDGPATFAALREIDGVKDIPIVFMTAKVMQDEVGRLRELGALGVIAKPFDPMKLPDLVREIWHG